MKNCIARWFSDGLQHRTTFKSTKENAVSEAKTLIGDSGILVAVSYGSEGVFLLVDDGWIFYSRKGE